MNAGRVLVIRHGALGDIVLSFPAFAGIRAAHPASEITLLTTAAFASWLGGAPWFDRVVVDRKPVWWDVAGLVALRRTLAGFDIVYDLQTSQRSSRYFRLAGRPAWSGIAAGCAYPHDNPRRDAMHTRERIAEQMAMAGIADLPVPDVAWAREAVVDGLPERFIVLAPGGAAHRPEKRWDAARFGALAAGFTLPVVIVGTAAERELAEVVRRVVPGAIDLTGRTGLAELGFVLARAALAIGNDTGPMHLAAALGVPCVVLFGGASDPALTAPRLPDGGWVGVLRVDDLGELGVEEVRTSFFEKKEIKKLL